MHPSILLLYTLKNRATSKTDKTHQMNASTSDETDCRHLCAPAHATNKTHSRRERKALETRASHSLILPRLSLSFYVQERRKSTTACQAAVRPSKGWLAPFYRHLLLSCKMDK
mmetsp:Transcript_52997/g.103667  ORF Transcript_52997/g.103667 Transcript_52997/m.103667 type:complete len:113 (+) Transcript_52997:777-1115(+)